jgi:polyisoprenoid-binding protein YceI
MLAPNLLLFAIALSLDLDPAMTDIQFTLHDVLHTVHGTFKLKKGSISFDPGSGRASGEIVVDVTSGASGNDARDSRMQKGILESQRFSEASFRPDHVNGKLAPQGESQIDVHGVFKLHGVDHELALHFQVGQAGGRYIAATHFVIPYVQWGMKNPSNFLLKVDKTVDMDIKTTINANR